MCRTPVSICGRRCPTTSASHDQLFEQQHVTVLPGSYIARDTPHGNPGRGRVRISLVAAVSECAQAAARIREFLG
jgi:N-succinyldiaminopimelate aminotransferase